MGNLAYYCSNCKGTIDKKVYEYSKEKYEKILCRNCQKKIKTPSKSKLKKRNSTNSFDYDVVKGRIAETLVEQLFIKLGYGVYRYGMENTIPGIMDLLKGVRSDVSEIIKRMPDFVIQDKQGEVHFIEVKFRGNEKFSIKNIDKDYPFQNAFFIVISRKHIKCLSYKQLEARKEITPSCKNYLGSIKEFETDKKIIIDFCKYAVKFFEGI